MCISLSSWFFRTCRLFSSVVLPASDSFFLEYSVKNWYSAPPCRLASLLPSHAFHTALFPMPCPRSSSSRCLVSVQSSYLSSTVSALICTGQPQFPSTSDFSNALHRGLQHGHWAGQEAKLGCVLAGERLGCSSSKLHLSSQQTHLLVHMAQLSEAGESKTLSSDFPVHSQLVGKFNLKFERSFPGKIKATTANSYERFHLNSGYVFRFIHIFYA